MKTSAYLRQQPRSYILGLAVLLAILLSSVEYLINRGIHLTPLYLIPIAIAAVPLGRWGGYLVSAVSIASMYYLTHQLSQQGGITITHHINFAIWGVAFLFVSEVLARVKSAFVTQWEQARRDGLTGAATSEFFYEGMEKALGQARRKSDPLAVASISVLGEDGSERVKDETLVGIAAVLKKIARTDDLVGRTRDSRFTIFMPSTHHKSSVLISRRVEDHLIKEFNRHGWKSTFSVSAVCFENLPANLEELRSQVRAAADEVAAQGQNLMKHRVI